MSQHAWDEITIKLNDMAKENRLIKQAVCKTYNTTTGVLGKSKNKTLATNLMIEPTIINSLIKVQRMLGLAQEIKTLS